MKNVNKDIISGVFTACKNSVNVLNMLSWPSSDQKKYAEFLVVAKDYISTSSRVNSITRERDAILRRFSEERLVSINDTMEAIEKIKEGYEKKTKELNDTKSRLGNLQVTCITAAVEVNKLLIDPYEPEDEEEAKILNTTTVSDGEFKETTW